MNYSSGLTLHSWKKQLPEEFNQKLEFVLKKLSSYKQSKLAELIQIVAKSITDDTLDARLELREER